MINEGDVFLFGNKNKAVVVKILDEQSGSYYCVYLQNNEKYVVSEFLYSDNAWSISSESGRVIKPSEWSQHVAKLKG